MTKAITIMKREHLSLNTVLHVLNQLVLDLESGRLRSDDVDYELIEKIMHYIEEFLDTMHHPKEDNYLFPALLKKTSEANDVILELQEQHQKGGAPQTSGSAYPSDEGQASRSDRKSY